MKHFCTIAFMIVVLVGSCCGQSGTEQALQRTVESMYPELTGQHEIISAAVLAESGIPAPQRNTPSAVIRKIANRARVILQKSSDGVGPTDEAAFRAGLALSYGEAKRLYPDIENPRSALRIRFDSERAQIQRLYPDYFKKTGWPFTLVKACAQQLAFEQQEQAALARLRSEGRKSDLDQMKEMVEWMKTIRELRDLSGRE